MISPGVYTREIDLTSGDSSIDSIIPTTGGLGGGSTNSFNSVSNFDFTSQDITTTFSYDTISKRKSLYADNNYCI